MDQLAIGRTHRHPTRDTPVAVLAHTFPVDTSTLTHLWVFLRDSLHPATLTAGELLGIDAAVAEALLDIDDTTVALHLSVRVFAHSVEVDVMLSNEPAGAGHLGPLLLHGQRHFSRQHRTKQSHPTMPATPSAGAA